MAEQKTELTNQELGQRYYGRLDAAVQDLATKLQKIKEGGATSETVEEATVDLSRLRKDFTDAIPHLPSYDQRNIDQKIKAIESDLERVRGAAVPKTKFAFKRKAANTTASAAVPRPPTPTIPIPPGSASPDTPATSGLSISGHSHRYLTLSSVSSPWSSASDLTISDLNHCIVNLIPSEANPNYPSGLAFTALHVKNLSNTVLVLPIITGSALLHDMKNCVIALGSRQFRIHASSQVDVYITAFSSPIIEHCSAMHFAAYPASLKHFTLTQSSVLTDPTRQDVQSNENHLAVQDFSHIRATPSPNWSTLPQEAAIQDGQWPLSPVENVDAVLQGLLPSR
ncbi:tubulin binding cofactor C-domain-containing protein [Dichomitus squalens]|nr:tubulin binding cofactor C-domain-containing protein [Dichomitus squalens]